MEFEDTWREMIETYELENHSWFSGIYRLRSRWATIFTRGIFTAGLLATLQSESMNRVLKDVCRASLSLFEFVKEYKAIQSRWRVKEREEDTHCIFLPGQFVEGNELAKQVAIVYTRTVYKIFEGEMTHSFNVILNEVLEEVGSKLLYSDASAVSESCVRNITFDLINNHACCTYAKLRTSFPANEAMDGDIMEYMLFVNQCMRQVYDIATSTKDWMLLEH
ncbi:protein FAR1-RELATED SEQUENCE 9-like [Salvia miltiorrhiza]|uniref:protein FAR1-RELATED SEQUENCE 9-like n=1 Tax=Salvia miltiorrhiza TaxID=226208 RepID=UPI0025ABE0AD|nr:protein FAR1-RELATED SEQUENCE 9-like [Salvia miltiorrhiza]